MNEILQSIVTTVISTTVIIGILGFIGKAFITKFFDGVVEKYKSQLNHNLEEFKSKNQSLLEENKIRYSRLHEDRANIIRDLYKRLLDLESKINAYVYSSEAVSRKSSPIIEISDEVIEQSKRNYEESINQLSDELIFGFLNYVEENEIFFNEDLMQCLNKLKHSLYSIRALHNISKESLEGKLIHGGKIINVAEDKDWNESLGKILSEIKSIKAEIKKEFRNLLGVK